MSNENNKNSSFSEENHTGLGIFFLIVTIGFIVNTINICSDILSQLNFNRGIVYYPIIIIVAALISIIVNYITHGSDALTIMLLIVSFSGTIGLAFAYFVFIKSSSVAYIIMLILAIVGKITIKIMHASDAANDKDHINSTSNVEDAQPSCAKEITEVNLTCHVTFTSIKDPSDVIQINCIDASLPELISKYKELGYSSDVN